MSQADEIILNDLSHQPIWVGWREKQRNGDAIKMPYDPRTGKEAKTSNPKTWATRGEAEFWAAANQGGVGIVLAPLNGGENCLCGIDLDTCRDPNTETFQDWAQEVIDRFATYTEVSPSRSGAKLLFTHASVDLPAIEKLFGDTSGKQFKNGGGRHCPAIEIYRGKRYFTVTDESIGPTDIIRQVSFADLEWLINNAGPKCAHKERRENQKSGPGNDHSRSGKAFRKGAALKAAGCSFADMRDALLADENPEIRDWARTKGLANDEREMRRMYENADWPNGPDARTSRTNGDDPGATAGPFVQKYKNLAVFIREYQPISYTLEGILPSSVFYFLTARRSTGKTAFLIAALFAIILGNAEILGVKVKKGRVAYVALENPTDLIGTLAAYLAGCVDHRAVLGPGERGVLPIMAASTLQAVQFTTSSAAYSLTSRALRRLFGT